MSNTELVIDGDDQKTKAQRQKEEEEEERVRRRHQDPRYTRFVAQANQQKIDDLRDILDLWGVDTSALTEKKDMDDAYAQAMLFGVSSTWDGTPEDGNGVNSHRDEPARMNSGATSKSWVGGVIVDPVPREPVDPVEAARVSPNSRSSAFHGFGQPPPPRQQRPPFFDAAMQRRYAQQAAEAQPQDSIHEQAPFFDAHAAPPQGQGFGNQDQQPFYHTGPPPPNAYHPQVDHPFAPPYPDSSNVQSLRTIHDDTFRTAPSTAAAFATAASQSSLSRRLVS